MMATMGDEWIVNYVYPLLGAQDADAMFTRMLLISIIYTASVLISMLLFPAPYGRYSDKRYGCFIPGKFAWITQGTYIPNLCILYFEKIQNLGWKK